MEAMSMGIPVIATDVGGTLEIIYDSDCCILLNADFELNDLVCSIRQIIN